MSEIKSRLTLDVKDYERKLQQAERRTKRFADNTGREGKRAGKEFKRGADEAQKGWTSVTSRIESALKGLTGVIAAVFSVQIIRRFTGAVVDALEDLSTYQGRFTALLGDAREAERVLSRLRDRGGPTATFQAMETVSRFMTAGLDADEAIEQLRRLEDAAANLSDNIKDGVEGFARNFLDLANRSQVSYRMLDRMARSGLPVYEMLGRELDKTKEELIAMAQEGALPAKEVMEALNRQIDQTFAGGGASMSGHLTTQLGRIRDNVRLLMADLGSVVVPQIAGDFAGLADRLGGSEASGLRETLKGISETLASIYSILSSVTKAVTPLIPTLLQLGVAFAVFKTAQLSINGTVRGLKALGTVGRRVQGVLKEIPNTYNPAQGVSTVYVGGAPQSRPKPDRLDPSAVALDKQLGIPHGHAIRMANWRMHEQAVLRNKLATRQFGNVFTRTMARGQIAMHGFLRGSSRVSYAIRGFLGGVRRLIAAIGGWPVVIATVVAALSFLWTRQKHVQARADELTRAIREQKKAVDDLAESYDKLDGRQQFSRRRQMEDDALDGYNQDVELPDHERPAQSLQEALRQADRMVLLYEGRIAEHSRFRRESAEAGLSVAAAPELDAALEKWKDWRERLAYTISSSETLHRKGLDNLAYQLAAVEESLRPLQEAEHLSQEQQQRLQELLAERDRLREELGHRDTGRGDPDPDPLPAEPRSFEELAREAQLLKTREDLRSQLREILDLEDQIALIREQNTHPEASSAQIEAGEELIGLLEDELDAKRGIYNQTEQILELEEKLTPAVREAAREFGSLADALAAGITTEDLDLVAEITETTQELERHLKGLELQLNLDLASTTDPDERAQLEAEAEKAARIVAETYQAKIQEFIEQLRTNAPPELKALLDRLIEQLATTVSSNIPADEVARMSDSLWDFVQTGQGLHRIAQDLKLIGEEGSRVAEGILSAVDAVDQLRRTRQYLKDNNLSLSGTQGVMAQLPAYVGIASGIITAMQGFISPMFDRGSEDALKEMADEMKRSAREISRSIDRYVEAVRKGEDATGRDRERIAAAWEGFTAIVDGVRSDGDYGNHHQNQATLEAAFLSLMDDLDGFVDTDELRKVYDALRQAGLVPEEIMEALLGGPDALEAVLGRLPDWQFDKDVIRDILGDLNLQALIDSLMAAGEFGDNIRGILNEMNFFTRFVGEDVPDAFQRMIERLLSLDTLDDALREKLEEVAGLDVSTESGRARLKAIVQEIAAAFPDFMGGLDAGDLESLLERLLEVAEREEDGGEDWNRNLQYLRTITAAEANEMVILLKEIAHYLRRMYEGSHLPMAAVSPAVYSATALPSRSAFSAQFGDIHISVSSMDRVAQESARELEKAVSRRLRRPY